MKITILNLLFLSTLVLCKVPPPYSQRGFIPSPQLTLQSLNLQSPQSQYSLPKQNLNTLNVNGIPSKLTIEELIRLTEELQQNSINQGRIVNRPQRIQVSLPQSSYVAPIRKPQAPFSSPQQLPQSPFRPPPAGQPQIIYGPPSKQHSLPQNLPRPIQGSNFVPQTEYGAPNKQQVPQNSYRAPHLSNIGPSNNQAAPQTSYGAPQASSFARPSAARNVPQTQYQSPQSSNNQIPSTSYGVPDVRSVETFDQFRNQQSSDGLRNQLLQDLSKQHLPYRQPTGFRPQSQSLGSSQGPTGLPNLGQQYLPTQSGSGEGQNPLNAGTPNVGQHFGPQNTQQPGVLDGSNTIGGQSEYLPPKFPSSTTLRSTFVPATTLRPRVNPTPLPVDEATADYDYDNQLTTESPSNEDGSDEAGPNVSVSNAVAGGGNFFYLQQPDGRLQRVVLQKTQEPNSKPEEYVANYYFQNIQALPNAAYNPLITLGTYGKR